MAAGHASRNQEFLMKILFALALTCAGLMSDAVAANVLRVGTGPGCTHATIQSALNAAANDGHDPTSIMITRSLSYTDQALRINDREAIELIGGFERCADTAPGSGYTRIDGTGGAQQTVIAVVGSYPSSVALSGLEITGGDAEDHEYGGGVYARHGGLLSVANSAIHGNRAGRGGGIAVEGQGTTLALRDNVLIYDNGALYEGGGAYCRDGDVFVFAVNSGLFNNNAVNEGGGLRLNNCNAELATNGPYNVGILYGNTAYDGAGLSALNSAVKVYSLRSNAPNRIGYNRASSRGGGILLRDASSITLWDTVIEGNSASAGAAGWAYSSVTADPKFRLRSARNRDAETPIGAVACASGVNCNRVTGNVARVSGNGLGEGAAFYYDWSVPSSCQFPFYCFWPEGFVANADIQDAQIDRNSGHSLIYFRQHNDHYGIAQSLIFGNTLRDAMIKTGDDDKVWIAQTTITGNTVVGALVRAPHLDLRCVVANQSGQIHQGSGETAAQFVLMPDTAQLPANTTVFQGVPRFVSASNDNFRLYPGQWRVDPSPSPGIDIASGCGVFQRGNDLDGLSRPVDGMAANQFGTFDLGPYEARASWIGF
jgi:hypothetical protein